MPLKLIRRHGSPNWYAHVNVLHLAASISALPWGNNGGLDKVKTG
jgi:hypothetical protein